jgi:UDP-N-acetylmuramoyl-L-alanyl-D-glutamate--2,6-diaminopimelate ligase
MKVPSTAPFEVIVDFAHTDSSMSNLLDGLRPECQGRLLVVFGAGGDKDPARRTTLPEVVIDKADVGVITLDNPRSEPPMNIINTMVGHWQEMEKQVANPASCHVEPDRTTAIHWALSQAQPKDIVVMAGKGHETTQIFADRVEHHDDFAIAEAWLKDHYPQ